MATRAKSGVQHAALFNVGLGRRELKSRRRNWLNHSLVRRQRGGAAKRERQKFSWRNLSFAGGSIAQHLRSAPSGEYGDVLLAIHFVGHRWRHDPDSRVEFPQQLAIGRLIGTQLSIGAPLKNEAAGGGESSPAAWIREIDMPSFALGCGIPSDEPPTWF